MHSETSRLLILLPRPLRRLLELLRTARQAHRERWRLLSPASHRHLLELDGKGGDRDG